MNYTELVAGKDVDGSIRNWCSHAALPSATILNQAQPWIYSRIRTRDMRTRYRWTVLAGVEELVLPGDFIEPINLYIDGQAADVKFLDEQLFRISRDQDGTLPEGWPAYWTVMGNRGVFDVQFDEDRSGDLWYYARPPLLNATTNISNYLTDRYPALLLQVCQAYAYKWLKRYDEANAEFAAAENECSVVNQQEDAGRRGQIR